VGNGGGGGGDEGGCGGVAGGGGSGAGTTLAAPERLALAAFEATHEVSAITSVRQVLCAVGAELAPAVDESLLPAACRDRLSPPVQDVLTGKVEIFSATYLAGQRLVPSLPERNRRLLALADLQYQFRSGRADFFTDQQLESPAVDDQIETNRQLAGPGRGIHM